jgi:FkbM family methyltransferase
MHFVVSELLNRESLRLVEIASEKLHIRTSTPDLKVAASSLIHGEYDPIQCDNPSVIIDVGANVGTSAVYFTKRYPNAKVLAIEPEQENYSILLRNTKKYQNIIPIRTALWGEKSTRAIQDRLTGPWGYTLAETTNKTKSTDQRVECTTIDALLNDYNLNHIDILKMDIEGSEKSVFEHCESWIDKVNIIVAELHDRICMGCDRAFYLATKDFSRFERNGDKVTAYKD